MGPPGGPRPGQRLSRSSTISPNVELEPKWATSLSSDRLYRFRPQCRDPVHDASGTRGACGGKFAFVVGHLRGADWGKGDWQRHSRPQERLWPFPHGSGHGAPERGKLYSLERSDVPFERLFASPPPSR
jgi:hypothetical protein